MRIACASKHELPLAFQLRPARSRRFDGFDEEDVMNARAEVSEVRRKARPRRGNLSYFNSVEIPTLPRTAYPNAALILFAFSRRHESIRCSHGHY
jgi:hypothetical protein